MKEELIPINGLTLGNVSYDANTLLIHLHDDKQLVTDLVEQAQLLSDDESRTIDSYISVQNIKKASAELSIYLGIANMLLSNIRSDLETIRYNRNMYVQVFNENNDALANAERQKKFRESSRAKE